MSKTEIDVDPCDHITSDAIGQPGQRVFYIQALQADKTYTVIIEKTQLQSMAVGIEQFLAEVSRQNPNLEEASADYVEEQMRINPPVDPAFRVGEIGLGYDQTRDRVVLFVREVQADEPEPEQSRNRNRNRRRERSIASGARARSCASWRAGAWRSPAAGGRCARSAGSPWSPRAISARRRTGTCTSPDCCPCPSQTAVRELEEALREGELELQGQFMLGSNYTFLVRVRHNGPRIARRVQARRAASSPCGIFRKTRWRAAKWQPILVSEALGFHFVPCTVLREDVPPYGTGSLQQYIEYDPEYHYFNFSEEDKARLPAVALFDVLVNNADRKGSHVLIETGTRKLWAIDHGLCFHEEDKLRTVIWDAAGHAIPANLLASLAQVPVAAGGRRASAPGPAPVSQPG